MSAVILFRTNATLALITLVPLPFIAWMIDLVRDKLRTGFEKIDRVWGEVTNVLADTIPGIRVVKAFAQEKREAHRFYEANKHNLAVNDRLNKVWSLFSPTVSFLTELGLLVIWCFGIWQVSRGATTVGTLTSFIAYSGRFYTRLDSMSRIVSVTQKSASAAKRIFDILDHVSSVPDPVNPIKLDSNGNFAGGGDHVKANITVDAHLSYDFATGWLTGDGRKIIEFQMANLPSNDARAATVELTRLLGHERVLFEKEHLLTYGFAEEIINKVSVDSIKTELDAVVLNRLSAVLEA